MTERVLVSKVKHISQRGLHVIHTHNLGYLLRLVAAVLRPNDERHFAVEVVVKFVNGDIAGVVLGKGFVGKGVVVVVILVLLLLDLSVMVSVDDYYCVVKQAIAIQIFHKLTYRLIGIVHRLEVIAELSALEERTRDFLIHTRFLVILLVLEAYVEVAYAGDV